MKLLFRRIKYYLKYRAEQLSRAFRYFKLAYTTEDVNPLFRMLKVERHMYEEALHEEDWEYYYKRYRLAIKLINIIVGDDDGTKLETSDDRCYLVLTKYINTRNTSRFGAAGRMVESIPESAKDDKEFDTLSYTATVYNMLRIAKATHLLGVVRSQLFEF